MTTSTAVTLFFPFKPSFKTTKRSLISKIKGKWCLIMGKSFINRYQVVVYKCKTRMNDGRKRNELPVKNTENREEKNIYYLLCSVIRYSAGLSFFSDSE